jgi:hypothetical protein
MTSRKLNLVAVAVALVGGAAREVNAQAPANDSGQVTCPPQNPNESSVACPQTPAQPAPAPAPQAAEPAPVAAAEPEWYETFGFALSVGGGVDDFTNSEMRNVSSIGGSWNARLVAGTHSYIGAELSYVGSAQSLNNLSGLTSSTLFSNGVQLDLRINATTNYPIQPYIFGGGAYRRYGMSSSGVNLQNFEANSNVAEVPAGLGLAAYLGPQPGLVLDVRGEYRFAWGDEMLPGTSGSQPTLNRWGVSGNIGYAF